MLPAISCTVTVSAIGIGSSSRVIYTRAGKTAGRSPRHLFAVRPTSCPHRLLSFSSAYFDAR